MLIKESLRSLDEQSPDVSMRSTVKYTLKPSVLRTALELQHELDQLSENEDIVVVDR